MELKIRSFDPFQPENVYNHMLLCGAQCKSKMSSSVVSSASCSNSARERNSTGKNMSSTIPKKKESAINPKFVERSR